MDDEPAIPPEDAQDWTHEQWLDWLKATDTEPSDGDDQVAIARKGIAHSTGGSLVGNAMIGLANALYGQRDDEPAIIVESEEPEDERDLVVHLDFEHPDRSTAIVRSRSKDE